MERLLTSKLRDSFKSAYQVHANRKLGNSLIDALMIAKSDVREDLIVEVKLIRKGFGASWLYEVMQATSRSVDLYEKEVDRLVRGLLIIVLEDDAVGWLRKRGAIKWIAARARVTPLVNVRLMALEDLYSRRALTSIVVETEPQIAGVGRLSELQ
ncbi:hypothetical protein ACHZ97_07370 [Lysobacter soli]|uniref:hypothetical protein n=1 Tax=Lysobacter soli TaxID=453783 RepID=UPI0037C7516C